MSNLPCCVGTRNTNIWSIGCGTRCTRLSESSAGHVASNPSNRIRAAEALARVCILRLRLSHVVWAIERLVLSFHVFLLSGCSRQVWKDAQNVVLYKEVQAEIAVDRMLRKLTARLQHHTTAATNGHLIFQKKILFVFLILAISVKTGYDDDDARTSTHHLIPSSTTTSPSKHHTESSSYRDPTSTTKEYISI